jgi:hypothetical protein
MLMEIPLAYGDYQLYFYRNVIYLGVLMGVVLRLPSLDTPAPTNATEGRALDRDPDRDPDRMSGPRSAPLPALELMPLAGAGRAVNTLISRLSNSALSFSPEFRHILSPYFGVLRRDLQGTCLPWVTRQLGALRALPPLFRRASLGCIACLRRLSKPWTKGGVSVTRTPRIGRMLTDLHGCSRMARGVRVLIHTPRSPADNQIYTGVSIIRARARATLE